MDLISIPNNSYAYKNFITDAERLVLKQWLIDLYNRGKLMCNGVGTGRHWSPVPDLNENVVPLFYEVKKKIMEHENLSPDNLDEHLTDFVSINLPGASIHPHTDPNRVGHTNTRFNLIVNKADRGGYPIYGDTILNYENCMLWRCEAGRYTHSSTPVQGNEYRINISYGFQVPLNNQQEVHYE